MTLVESKFRIWIMNKSLKEALFLSLKRRIRREGREDVEWKLNRLVSIFSLHLRRLKNFFDICLTIDSTFVFCIQRKGHLNSE